MTTEKIIKLQKILPYYCYQKLLDNGFDDNKLEQVFDEIDDCSGYFDNFSIVDKHEGNKLESENNLIIFADEEMQYEDSYSGWVWVKINDNEYLRWSYMC